MRAVLKFYISYFLERLLLYKWYNKITWIQAKHVVSWDINLFILDSVRRLDSFHLDSETGSHGFTCSTLLNGRMLIIGGKHGSSFTRQISKVTDCGLSKTEHQMPEDSQSPACNTFIDGSGGEFVLICFAEGYQTGCYQ